MQASPALDGADWSSDDAAHRRDIALLPPGELAHRLVTLNYDGIVQYGILCLTMREVYFDFYSRFLGVSAGEEPAPKGVTAQNEPWTLIHPTMGVAWVQASHVLRRASNVHIPDSVGCTFIAFVDDVEAFCRINNGDLGSCNKDGQYTAPRNEELDIIIALGTYRSLGAPSSLLHPPCPVPADLLAMIDKFHAELHAEPHKRRHPGTKLLKLNWFISVFKPYVYSKGLVKPNTPLHAQTGNLAIMDKEDWERMSWRDTKKDEQQQRPVVQTFYQPVFSERVCALDDDECEKVASAGFKSSDKAAEEASCLAVEEIARLAASGWVAERPDPCFYD